MNILKNNSNIDSEYDDACYVVTSNNIEEMLLPSAYDGDNLRILTDKAVDAANKAYNDFHFATPEEDTDHYEYELGYKIGDIIYACRDVVEIYGVKETKEGTDYENIGNKVKAFGFNYWNGSRFTPITVQRDDIEPEFTVIDDEAIISQIKEAFENKEFVKSQKGVEYYEYQNIRIEISAWSSDFEDYKVYID